MKLLVFSIVALAFSGSVVVRAAGPVMSLEEEELDSYVAKKSIVMLDIYKPNCPHCKALAPEFLKAAKLAQENGNPYFFVKINVNDNPGIASRFHITGYPTLKLFVNGVPINYEGNRTAEAILEFINKKYKPQSQLINDIEEIAAEGGLRGVLVTDKQTLIDQYVEIIRDENDFKFYHIPTRFVKEKYPELNTDPSFILFKEHDEKKVVFSKPGFPKRDFKSFLRTYEYPTINPCSEKVIMHTRKANSERALIILLHSEQDTEQIEKEFRELALEKRAADNIFVIANAGDKACNSLVHDIEVPPKGMPTLQIIERKQWERIRYEYKGKLAYKEIKRFYEQWKKGQVKRVYKTEDIPKENPGPVYKAVGKNYDEIVLKSDQDVFVKFYAPWCGDCKELAPIYEDLAKKMSNHKNLKFVEIDSTKNEIPEVRIDAYPTLKLYKANDKNKPIKYEGPRTMENMEKFLREHSSFSTKSDL